jgi:hypothetical protein
MKPTTPDIHQLDLAELCTYADNAYRNDKTSLGGDVFALLAKKLVAAEVEPGGPYKNKAGKVTVRLNKAVSLLFNRMGAPLPQVDAFLANTQAKTISVSKRRRAPTTGTKQLAEPYEAVRTALAQKAEPVRTQAIRFLERVSHADTTGEISSIATFAAQSLGINIPKETLVALGEANIYGWIAYMIYDHIIDGESDAALLPLANIAMRQSLSRYKIIAPNDAPTQQLIDHLFDDIDEANAWELAACRFPVQKGVITLGALPDYKHHGVLARRSGIHILGPLIAARLSAYGEDTEKMQHLTHGLRHYLIARQLSDDIHDWKDDITAGHITAVVAQLIAQRNDMHKKIPLKTMLPALEKDFLHHAMQDVCKNITHHIEQTKRSFALAGCVNGPLFGLVTRLENMTTQSLAERSRFLAFQTAYTAQDF